MSSRRSRRSAQAGASGVLGFLNLFCGGALVRLAIFGLGVMPYITSSIIIQLLSTVIPKLEEWRDQGAVGQKKITQTTRYLTVALALMQSTGLVYAFHGHDSGLLGVSIDLIPKFTVPLAAFMVLCLTAGTAFVMWLAELITQRGIGQGMSILIFANVVASIPLGGKAISRKAGRSSSSPSSSSRWSCWSSSSSWTRASAASRSPSPNGWSGGACTAARAPTSRSKSTSRA